MNAENCKICNVKLTPTNNCGGDCLSCMILVGEDPDCLQKVAEVLEKSPRPMLTGKELSQNVGDLLDGLDCEGFLHDGERKVFTQHIVLAVLKAVQ